MIEIDDDPPSAICSHLPLPEHPKLLWTFFKTFYIVHVLAFISGCILSKSCRFLCSIIKISKLVRIVLLILPILLIKCLENIRFDSVIDQSWNLYLQGLEKLEVQWHDLWESITHYTCKNKDKYTKHICIYTHIYMYMHSNC